MLVPRSVPCWTKWRDLWARSPGMAPSTTTGVTPGARPALEDDVGPQVCPLLDQVAGPVASFTGDGAYAQDGVSASVAARPPEATIIVPPRATAVLSETAESAPTPRDRHLQHIAEHG